MDSENRAADYVLFFAKVRSFPEDATCKVRRACRREFKNAARRSGLLIQKHSVGLPADTAPDAEPGTGTPQRSSRRNRRAAPYEAFYWAFKGTDKALLGEAERLKMQLPLKNWDQTPLALIDELAADDDLCCGGRCNCLEPVDIEVGQEHPLKDKRLNLITAPFVWSKRHLFYGGPTGTDDNQEAGTMKVFPLTGAQRIYLTHSILQHIDVQTKLQAPQSLLCRTDCMYCRCLKVRILEQLPIVLEHLLAANIFADAFAVHDRAPMADDGASNLCCLVAGSNHVQPGVPELEMPELAATQPGSQETHGASPARMGGGPRQRLGETWHCCCRQQPLRLIRMYFGEKLGFYYAWHGFMISHLSSLVGIGLAFLVYGLIYATSQYKSETAKLISQLENSSAVLTDGNGFTMHLVELMQFIKLMFDNHLTIPFGCILTLWSQSTVRGWRKYEANLSQRWGVVNHRLAEHPKPGVARRQQVQSPYRRCFGVLTIVMFCVVVAVAVAVSFQVSKLVASKSHCKGRSGDSNSQTSCFFLSVILPISGHLVLMGFLDWVYGYLAKVITNMENHKFRGDHDTSYALKAFGFRFANNFASLVHIAFARQENIVFGEISDICSKNNIEIDCFNLLSVYTAGYIVGKALLKCIVDSARHNQRCKRLFSCMSSPLGRCLCSFFAHLKRAAYTAELDALAALERDMRAGQKSEDGGKPPNAAALHLSQERDLPRERSPEELTDEYLEKMILHGYIVLFGSANYLAPLAILIAMLLDVRQDARHMVARSRRPVPLTAGGVGIWNQLHEFLGHVGTFSTGGILAFTTGNLRVHGIEPSTSNRLALFIAYTGAMQLMRFVITACLEGRSNPLKMQLKWEYHNVPRIIESGVVAPEALENLRDMQSSDSWFRILLPCFASVEPTRPESGPHQV